MRLPLQNEPAVADEVRGIRDRIADRALIGLAAIAIPALSASLLRIVDTGWLPIMGLHIAVAGSVFAMALLRRRLAYAIRAGYLVGILAGLGVGGLLSLGLLSGGPALLLGAAILAFLLFNVRIGIAAFLFSLVVMFSTYALFAAGLLTYQAEPVAYLDSFSTWLTRAAAIGLIATMVGLSIVAFSRSLSDALARERRERSMLDRLVEAAPEGIAFLDQSGAIRRANRRIEQIFGYPFRQLTGKPLSVLIPDVDFRNYQDLASGHSEPTELTGRNKNGENLPISLSIGESVVSDDRAYVALISDLSERKRFERQLQQAQKMEAVGQLTGGIAHDFNNLLAIVSGNADLLEADIGDHKRLQSIRRAALQGAATVTRLLAFARGQPGDPEPVNLPQIVPKIGELLVHTLGGRITLTTKLPDLLWPVMVDLTQLENSVLNIAINARDAMPNGGEFTIEAANISAADLAELRLDEVGLDQGAVVLRLRDNGCGMSEETLRRAADPFFTTKDASRGNGLGLAMVLGFAKHSGGCATIDSAENIGTTISIYLPAARGSGAPAPG